MVSSTLEKNISNIASKNFSFMFPMTPMQILSKGLKIKLRNTHSFIFLQTHFTKFIFKIFILLILTKIQHNIYHGEQINTNIKTYANNQLLTSLTSSLTGGTVCFVFLAAVEEAAPLSSLLRLKLSTKYWFG